MLMLRKKCHRFLQYCWWFRNRAPVDYIKYHPIIHKVLIHLRWCRICEPSTVDLRDRFGTKFWITRVCGVVSVVSLRIQLVPADFWTINSCIVFFVRCLVSEEILWLRSTMACIKHVVTWIGKKRETLNTTESTLPKFNIAPENKPSQKESKLPTTIFGWLC